MIDDEDQYDVGNRLPFHWETAISWKSKNEIVCRGYNVNDLAENSSFISMVFLLLRGELPNPKEEVMLNYLMTAFAEHAFSPSAISARMAASGRPPLNSAIAAGVMTFGEAHGPGHVYSELLVKLRQTSVEENKSLREVASEYVSDALRMKQKIPGLHQPQHTNGDPRAIGILKKASDLGLAGLYTELQSEIASAYSSQSGRVLQPNVLGAAGPTLLDMGFMPKACWAIGILSRAFSCAAHAIEEMETQSPWRASSRNPMVDILDLSLQGPKHYKGPGKRKVPLKQ